MPAILFYDVVVSVHVMAIVAAFGGWFAYPLVVPRGGDASAHRAQVRIARMVVTPAGTLPSSPASTWPAIATAGTRAGSASRC